ESSRREGPGAILGRVARPGYPSPGSRQPGRTDHLPSPRSWFCLPRHGDLCRHARLEHAVRIGHTHLDAKDLMPALIGALDIARSVFALRGNVLDRAREAFAGVTIDADLDLLTQTNAAEVGLRHKDLHPQLVGTKHPHDDLVGRNQIALADAQHLDHGLLGG